MKDNFKVYIHIFPNGKKYLGITMQEVKKRWNNGNSYKENLRLFRAIKKYGWNNIEHKVLFSNLSKEEAEKKEIELINKYKLNNKKYGYNIEYGGFHNGKTSEETRKKISIANKGKHNSIKTEFKKGHKVIITDEIKAKISQKNKGKHASVKTEFKKGHKALNNKKVRCVETQIIYNSIKEASIETNSNEAHISNVCRGKRRTTNKLHWEYVY